MSKFYVKQETAKGKIIAYGIYDCVGGLESEHERYKVPSPMDKASIFMKAKKVCDEMNKSLK